MNMASIRGSTRKRKTLDFFVSWPFWQLFQKDDKYDVFMVGLYLICYSFTIQFYKGMHIFWQFLSQHMKCYTFLKWKVLQNLSSTCMSRCPIYFAPNFAHAKTIINHHNKYGWIHTMRHRKHTKHTRAKSRDHEVVRARMKVSKGRPNTPPK